MLPWSRRGGRVLRLPADPRRSACGVRRCDLSEGIETDDAAGTVTIHLRRPDAEFLHKLANCATWSRPAARGARDDAAAPGHRPVQGQALRCRGAADCWCATRTSGSGRPTAPTASPTHRRAPRAWPDPARRRRRGGRRPGRRRAPALAQLRTLYGARLHTDPYADTRLRVPQRPRSAVRRRARPARAELRRRSRPRRRAARSAETEQPTCQLLPPASRATRRRVRSRRTRTLQARGPPRRRTRPAPRRRVGTRGMTVEFWSSTDFAPVGRYFRSLLRELGYRSQLRTFPDLHLIIENASRTRRSSGSGAGSPTRPARSTSSSPLVSSTGDTNLSRFCDPRSTQPWSGPPRRAVRRRSSGGGASKPRGGAGADRATRQPEARGGDLGAGRQLPVPHSVGTRAGSAVGPVSAARRPHQPHSRTRIDFGTSTDLAFLRTARRLALAAARPPAGATRRLEPIQLSRAD